MASRFLNLFEPVADPVTLRELSDRIKAGGVHVVFSHSSAHSAGDKASLIGELAKENELDILTIEVAGETRAEEVLKPGALVMLPDPGHHATPDGVNAFERLTESFREIRKGLEKGAFKDKALVVKAPSVYWDVSLRQELQSPLVKGKGGYHEYLGWNDGDLWKQDQWPTDSTGFGDGAFNAAFQRAWRGSGFALSCLPSADPAQKANVGEISLDAGFATAVNQGLEELQASEAAHRRWNKLHAQAADSQKTSVLLTLRDFMPPFMSTSLERYVRTASGQHEGPREWIEVEKLNALERHLLFDGWLTLWPNRTGSGLLLQPGSLAVLFCVAKLLDRPHSGSPDAFRDNYHWTKSPMWFGGQLSPQKSNS